MTTLNKEKNKDFVVLNIGDPQIDNELWGPDNISSLETVKLTLGEIVPKVKPDMITITGDLADEYGRDLYEDIISYVDSFGVPWAPVMGNHDHEDGCDPFVIAEMLAEAEHCIFEVGDPSMGCGHYTVVVEEDGRPITAFIMMDSHHRIELTDENGNYRRAVVPLSEAQYRWYEEQIILLRSIGCEDSVLVNHFPLYEYKLAWNAAIKPDVSLSSLRGWDPEAKNIWREEYRDSFGINCEPVEPEVEESRLFELARSLGHTKNILCAHDHGNGSSIVYRGIRLTYSLKTGTGGYIMGQNGCTVITIGENGVKCIHQEYVDLHEV